jgi:hypothetical protein
MSWKTKLLFFEVNFQQSSFKILDYFLEFSYFNFWEVDFSNYVKATEFGQKITRNFRV